MNTQRRTIGRALGGLLLGLGTTIALTACGSPQHAASLAALAAPVPIAPTGNAPAAPLPSTERASSVALRRLAQEFWVATLEADPLEATLLGYPGYDDRMPDESPEARERFAAQLRRLQTELTAQVLEAELSNEEQVTRGLLLGELDSELAVSACRLEEWSVDPRSGPQVAYLDLAMLQSVANPKAAAALLQRWRAMPAALNQISDNLKRGLSAGKTSARSEVARVSRQLDELLARPVAEWALLAPAKRATGATWTAEASGQFRAELTKVVEDDIRPAFVAYRQLVQTQILPRARGDAAVGILNVDGGPACYRALAKKHTSLSIDPEQVHQLGLEEVSRIRHAMEDLGPAAYGTSDFKKIQQRLRGSDRALYFQSREEIEAAARATLARADAAMPLFLGHLPKTPCIVKAIEPHAEKDSPIAYYREPAIDGSRPGTYYVNTYAPGTRPRFEAEALAFHESIPGHHVQIALAQELHGVPDFQRNLGVSAFVEGWGLYAEGLADELGLYSSPGARMGRLGLEVWRAARLVVDTGMHVRGWSRSRAVKYLLDNTINAPNDLENEVDRYIGWPGQALAYKLGERKLLELRTLAKERLGARFDQRRFHDVVLGQGAVSLPVLSAQIERWLQAEANSGVSAGASGAPPP
jgi:uncharacterized protein (DUF885 family)